MSLDFTADQSTLVQVMAWCRQAISHHLSQCWPRSLSPYGVTRPQWVNHNHIIISTTCIALQLRLDDIQCRKTEACMFISIWSVYTYIHIRVGIVAFFGVTFFYIDNGLQWLMRYVGLFQQHMTHSYFRYVIVIHDVFTIYISIHTLYV